MQERDTVPEAGTGRKRKRHKIKRGRVKLRKMN